MNKLDITNQSENELVLLVSNTEWLYNIRSETRLMREIDELFIYTHEQMNELKEYLKDEES